MAAARRLGIGMVFQHFSLFEALTVAENIALSLDEKISISELSKKAAELSVAYGLPLDPNAHVADLSVGEAETPPSVPDAQPVPAPPGPKE